MVFTLQRYIFREVFRVFLLAAVALTLMLTLGSILRPVQEYGVGPGQVVHLMGYFLPIILTFVLPMAALFASSLIYGRFASDNELDACRASGISLLTLVYPGLALAIIVAIANLILSFHVMPAFVKRAETSLKADAKQIIFRNIQRKGYYQQADGKYLIYADQADSENDILWGVAITEMEATKIQRIITAESAKVKFFPHRRFNEVQITAYNTYQMAAEEVGGFFMEKVSLTKEFPSLLGDDIKFKDIEQLKEIHLDPMQFYPIAKIASQTFAQFTAELLAQDITKQMAQQPAADAIAAVDPNRTFYRLHSGQKFVEFTTDNCTVREDRKIELTGEITVYESDAATKELLQSLTAEKALLHLEGDELAPTLTMEIYGPSWRRNDGSSGLARRYVIRGLILPAAVTNQFKTENIILAINPAATDSALGKKQSGSLTNLQRSLEAKVRKTFLEIKAEVHSRLVFGVGCVVMILIGIALGIVKKGGHLLSAFGVSCVPAAVLIVCIMMGKNVTKNPGASAGSGILLMWIGLVLLTLVGFELYRRLLKN